MNVMPVIDGARSGSPRTTIARGVILAALAAFQIGLLDRSYTFRRAVSGEPSPLWQGFNDALQVAAYAGLIAAAAFCVLAIARQRSVGADWLEAAHAHRWLRWFAAQSVLFVLLLATAPLFQNRAETTPWLASLGWLSGAAIMAGCAVLALAPFSFWRVLARRHADSALISLGVGIGVYGAILVSQNSWGALSAATLYSTHWLLSLYEANVHIDPATRYLGAGDFVVEIGAPCAGYEGIGLVLTMLSFYMFAFRRDLRFPHVLVLLPLGAAAIWLLNNVRLALLISIGAHYSPDIALGGFHSQAGWVLFLAVTIGFMVIAHKAPMFRAAGATGVKKEADPALLLATALLAPFAALMGARIVAAVFGAEAYWIGAAVIALPTAVIAAYWRTIRAELGKLTWSPVLIGLAVGALWIATEPTVATPDPLGAWLAQQPPATAAAWLALRIFGFALIVPIAEELVFRGYLHRALVKRRFETAAPAAFGWLAFILTSLLFGAMHGRWLAGALAGAAFAIALYRSKSLTGPIAAHVAANGLIAAYAIAAERWELI